MGIRRESRELALQYLYQQDVVEEESPTLRSFWNLQESNKAAHPFCEELVKGVLRYRPMIDEKIKGYAKNWEFHRIAVVDRNILRLAIYELLYRDDIPPVVSINEAIELAKKFSTEDSGSFVNGILDRVKLELTRPLRSAKDDE
jgi:transcription antitermination protein NusB